MNTMKPPGEHSRPKLGPASSTTSTRTPIPVVDIRDLVAGGREVIIRHADESYRLRITANNRLILTK